MTNGRKRLSVCSAGHRMTDNNRRWKYYVRLDGTSGLLSNGCRTCNAAKSAEYKVKNAEVIKARRCGVVA